MTICKLCNNSAIDELLETTHIRADQTCSDVMLDVKLLYSKCVVCGNEFVTKEQVLINDERVQEVRNDYKMYLEEV